MVNSINGIKFNSKHFEVITSENSNVIQLRNKKTNITISFNKNAQYENAKVTYKHLQGKLVDIDGLNANDPDMKVDITGSNDFNNININNSNVGNVELENGDSDIYINNSNIENIVTGDGDDYVFMTHSNVNSITSEDGEEIVIAEYSNIDNIELNKDKDAVVLENSTFENVNLGFDVDENTCADTFKSFNSLVTKGKKGQVTSRIAYFYDNIDQPLENVTVEAKTTRFYDTKLKNSNINANLITLSNVDSRNNEYSTHNDRDTRSAFVTFGRKGNKLKNDKIDSEKVRFCGNADISETEINADYIQTENYTGR